MCKCIWLPLTKKEIDDACERVRNPYLYPNSIGALVNKALDKYRTELANVRELDA